MIEVTRLNETKFLLNPDLIETIEETPDTVISLTTGKKIIVTESRQEIRNLVILYKQECIGNLVSLMMEHLGSRQGIHIEK